MEKLPTTPEAVEEAEKEFPEDYICSDTLPEVLARGKAVLKRQAIEQNRDTTGEES